MSRSITALVVGCAAYAICVHVLCAIVRTKKVICLNVAFKTFYNKSFVARAQRVIRLSRTGRLIQTYTVIIVNLRTIHYDEFDTMSSISSEGSDNDDDDDEYDDCTLVYRNSTTLSGAGDVVLSRILACCSREKTVQPVQFYHADTEVRTKVCKHPVYKLDTICCLNDLHTDVVVSLKDYFLGKTVRIPHPVDSRRTFEIEYSGFSMQQAIVQHREGLAYYTPATLTRSRGDVYIFFNTQLPMQRPLPQPDPQSDPGATIADYELRLSNSKQKISTLIDRLMHELRVLDGEDGGWWLLDGDDSTSITTNDHATPRLSNSPCRKDYSLWKT